MTHPENTSQSSQSNRSVAGTSHHIQPEQPGHSHPNMKVAPSSTTTGLNPSPSYNFIELIAIFMSWLVVIVFYPIALFKCIHIVNEHQRAVCFRLGKVSGGPKGPGSFFILPCIDDFRIMDLRTTVFDVPSQSVITKDSVTVQINAVGTIASPILAVTSVGDYKSSTQFLASTVIRNTFGTRMLADILADRPGIAKASSESLDEATDPWGIKVERVEIMELLLPAQLQRSMAAEGETARATKAKIVAAEGEVKASKALKEASIILQSNEGASKLRQLQLIAQMGSVNNTNVMVPMGFMSK
ncbi:unnamed protein product [Orchesella dallaii]|uniref:Band 7 domain-containing protein n=1 Tax=Orchesella dallaii TaxID=48710 RepID=A0ABP1QYJ4_9HEXA